MKVIRGSVREGENCKIDPTVEIDVDELHLGDNVSIEAGTTISGGKIHLGDNTKVGKFVEINVGFLKIGKYGTIRKWSTLEGTRIEGGHQFYVDRRADIGSGSSFDYDAFLKVGNWMHLGKGAELNTGRGITIGREVAMGPASKFYTHGTWGSVWEGRPERWGPIVIGDNAWMTYARVHPGVTIGRDSVVATGSIVDVDVPDGAHVMGVPISRFKEKWKLNSYPKNIFDEEKQKLIQDVIERVQNRLLYEKGIRHKFDIRKIDEDIYDIEGVRLHFALPRKIEGLVNDKTGKPIEMFLDQLRRRGIRFDYEVVDQKFVPYPDNSI